MKLKLMTSVLAVTVLVALQANCQRMRDNAEYTKQLEQFINESEIAGEISLRIKAQEAKSEELQIKIESLEIIQLKKQMDALAQLYPDKKEQLEELKTLAEKNLKLRRELADLQKQGRAKLESLDLKFEESRKLISTFNNISSGQPGRMQGMDAQWNNNPMPPEGARPGRENGRDRQRNERMQKQQEDMLNKLKQNNPDMYSLLAEQKKATDELNKLRDQLMNAFRDYQKAQSGK